MTPGVGAGSDRIISGMLWTPSGATEHHHTWVLLVTLSIPSYGYFQQDNDHVVKLELSPTGLCTQMASPVNRFESNRALLGCCGAGDLHHGCTPDKSAATAGCYHANMDQKLWWKFPALVQQLWTQKVVGSSTSLVYLFRLAIECICNQGVFICCIETMASQKTLWVWKMSQSLVKQVYYVLCLNWQSHARTSRRRGKGGVFIRPYYRKVIKWRYRQIRRRRSSITSTNFHPGKLNKHNWLCRFHICNINTFLFLHEINA